MQSELASINCGKEVAAKEWEQAERNSAEYSEQNTNDKPVAQCPDQSAAISYMQLFKQLVEAFPDAPNNIATRL